MHRSQDRRNPEIKITFVHSDISCASDRPSVVTAPCLFTFSHVASTNNSINKCNASSKQICAKHGLKKHQNCHFDELGKLVFLHQCLIRPKRSRHRQKPFFALPCFSARKLSNRSKALLNLYEFLSVENKVCVCVFVFVNIWATNKPQPAVWLRRILRVNFFIRSQCYDFNEVF